MPPSYRYWAPRGLAADVLETGDARGRVDIGIGLVVFAFKNIGSADQSHLVTSLRSRASNISEIDISDASNSS